MTFTVSVEGAGISFGCAQDETILDAAERAGYAIPYSCRKGVCSSCEGALSEGTLAVRGQGRREGPSSGVRFCQARPETDVTIAPREIRSGAVPERKSTAATVFRIDRPAPDVAIVKLRFPIGLRAPFHAGQYLRVLMEGGESRNYSMANAPFRNDGAELHVRIIPGGAFSDQVLSALGPGDSLEVELPFGTFGLDPEESGKAILLASGTGFAPFASIIRHQVERGTKRPMHLFWGCRKATDLYALDQLDALARVHSWLEVTPVLSEPDATWTGRTGLVHHAVMETYPEMGALDVHACGAPPMIAAARSDFVSSCDLDPSRFCSDAFVDSSDGAVSGP